MPELRQNLANKEWVIIATERARRPEEFHQGVRTKPVLPERSPDCPFCPGNEAACGTEHFSLGKPDWRVRVVANKFPALVPDPPPAPPHTGLYRHLPGEGIHEVIIDSPSHAKHPALLDEAARRDLFLAYRERFRAAAKDPKVALTQLFKNHGEGAGTSLVHPHSQLIGSSVVPAGVRHRMDEAQKYHYKHKVCVFCAMAEEERRLKVRILADTPHFTAFVLFAALSPFHIWVLPKRHTATFGDSTDSELDDLSQVMGSLLRRVDRGLGDPDYNYLIQSSPQDRGETDAFHWYLSLIVRLTRTAGFELGSGMYVNTSLPEESARFLNGIPDGA
ncbi:MAG: galactose-1-phosphate uridylyltransferase [Elusimicrobia bacterium GWA2_69_24]|nr:MAG: galactose-1-phosphate uridylyltransferase [Elusimicrobia bacterium GWA2_69_24]